MKKTLLYVLLSFPFLAIAQHKNYLEFKAGPNFTSISDGKSTARYGYDFSIGITSPSKKGNMDWNLSLMQSKSSTLIRYGFETTANPSIPGSDDVSFFDIQNSAYFLSLPLSLRYHLKEGKHSFYLENSLGPALLALGARSEEYHYKSNSDYVLEYKTSENIMDFRMMAGVGLGWAMQVNENVRFSLSPAISCMFLNFAKLFPNTYYYKPTFMIGVKGGLAFGY